MLVKTWRLLTIMLTALSLGPALGPPAGAARQDDL